MQFVESFSQSVVAPVAVATAVFGLCLMLTVALAMLFKPNSVSHIFSTYLADLLFRPT